MRHVLAVALLSLLCCSCNWHYASLPTGGVTSPEQAAEALLDGMIKNECLKLGLHVQVKFLHADQDVDGSIYGQPGETLTQCMGGKDNTVYVRPDCADLNWQAPWAKAAARHECCHLKLGHYLSPELSENIRMEQEADQCVQTMY